MSDLALVDAKRPPLAEWLTAPMRRNRAIYLKVAAAAVMVNLFGIATSLFTMTVYDRVVPNNATASLIALTIGIAIVILFDFVLRLLRAYFVDIAGARIDHEAGTAMFDKLVALRLDRQRTQPGALAGLMREFETLRDFFASATLVAIVDVPFVLLFLLVIALIGGWVAVVPLVMVPLVILAGLLTQPALDRLSARTMSEGLGKQAVLVETIGALETVKASRAGPFLARRWTEALVRHADSSLRQRLVSSIAVTIATSAQSIAYIGVVVAGVAAIARGDLTMGGLVACSILSGRAVAPLGQVAQLLSRLTATRAAYRQLDRMMSSPDERPADAVVRPIRFRGAIELREVSFRYPGADRRALTDVSLTIAPGERVALLGRVGSGKSTLARLLLGLHSPEEGSVLLDGSDVRQLHPDDVRGAIGAVLQDNVLLSGSIRDNIMLDRPGIDDDELLRVARLSGTHDFVGALANGYELTLADRGEGLSGGQRQSIALARALAGRPPVLLFDEPTSAMDQHSEATLIDRLETEIIGRTLLLITHRASLLQLAERVIVLDKGRIVADGPREQVLTRTPRAMAA